MIIQATIIRATTTIIDRRKKVFIRFCAKDTSHSDRSIRVRCAFAAETLPGSDGMMTNRPRI